MKMPKCCGKEMQINMEMSRFFEAICTKCGDTVYIKKDEITKPQMIDD